MSLSLALNTALSGLNVNQRSLAALSQNIANANNPEYSRKVISQEAVYLTGQGGAGVQIRDIGRRVDEYLQKSVRSQGSVYGRTEVISDYTERLQVLLGSPGSSNSIYSYAQNFFNALQSLSQTPENAALRATAVNVAQSTAREMRTLANGIYDMQYAIDQDIKASISSVNSNLRDIYTLNATISQNKMLGRPVSELEDRRDSLLKEVSSVLDVQTYTQSNGVMNVFTAGGQSLVDENVYMLSYNAAPSSDFFANGNAVSPIQIYRADDKGNRTGNPTTLVSAGVGQGVSTLLTGGKLKGWLEMRDQNLPNVLSKLDMLASEMRDELNAVHNSGVAFPGANSYTGTRALAADDYSQWSGQVRIAVLDQNGNPVPSNYTGEESGIRPLLIDLSTLDTGGGAGNVSVQGLINEINYYYGVPQNKVSLGNLNNISLALNNTSLPGLTPQLDFDFQLDNISGQNADFYVTDLQILDDTSTDITNIIQDVPKFTLSPTGTYTTTNGSGTVTVNVGQAHGFVQGQRVYLAPPSSDVNGIPANELGGYFTITNVTANGFDIEVPTQANATGSQDRTDVEVMGSYHTAAPGTNERTISSGNIVANIAANTTSQYYTVKATVAVVDENGAISSSTVTYRIDNLKSNVKNYRYGAASATGLGQVTIPKTAQPTMKAMLVDANGNELPIINNQYAGNESGYLKLVAGNSSYVVAIDSLNSMEKGKPNSSPAVAGTDRAFAHYFELNNFFTQNRTTGVSDDVTGSARNMYVSDALSSNVNLISLGKLSQSPAPVDPTKPPLYTYQRNFGDNSVISALASFNTKVIDFAPAGDLGNTSLSLSSYAGQIISTASTKATSSENEMTNAKLLLDGFNERADGVRGVNLDEELANTIIYQNAYAATARVISVANEFFDALLQAF